MPDTPDWTAIDRYLAHEATPEEVRAVEAWVAADARRATLLAVLRGDARSPDLDARWDADAAWARVAPRLTPDLAPPARLAPSPAAARWRAAPWRAAAALLLAAGIGGAAWWRVASPDHRELATAPGQRASTRLPDGTRVTLNAGSRLRWRATYGAAARDVELEGEGYFEVRHDAARPFRVHVRDVVAEDLGTRFSVRAYPELGAVDVAVAEGRVALQARPDGARALLAAGDVGRAEGVRAGAVARVVSRGATAERYFGWTAGALVFDGVPLAQALPQLERWYDVDVVIPDGRLAARPLVARFTRSTAAEALDAIALALDARWTRRGRTVTLEPRT